MEQPQTDSLARAIKSLAIAVWCLCALTLLQVGFYGFWYIRSESFMKQASSDRASARRPVAERTPLTSAPVAEERLYDLPPEEMIKKSSAILLTDGGPGETNPPCS